MDNRKKLTRARMPSNQDGNHNNELNSRLRTHIPVMHPAWALQTKIEGVNQER